MAGPTYLGPAAKRDKLHGVTIVCGMCILITGKLHSGQREVLETLIKQDYSKTDSFSGLVLQHHFETKYFTTSSGIWVDEFDNTKDWVADFTSDHAREVRDALTLFIYTFAEPNLDMADMAAFADSLGRPGVCIAVAKPGTDTSKLNVDKIEESGFDVVTFDRLEQVVHSALFDAVDDESEEDATGEPLNGPPRELEDVMAELNYARESKTMTDEEKRAVAERLAEELI